MSKTKVKLASSSDVSELLDAIRGKLKGMTTVEIQEFALRAEVSPATIYRLSGGSGRLPTLEVLIKMVNCLGGTIVISV